MTGDEAESGISAYQRPASARGSARGGDGWSGAADVYRRPRRQPYRETLDSRAGRGSDRDVAPRWPLWVTQSLAALVIFIVAVAYTHSGLPGQAQLRTALTRLVTTDYDFQGLLTRLPSWDKVKSVFGPGALTRLWWQGDDQGKPTGLNDSTGVGTGTGTGNGTGTGTTLRLIAPVPGAVSSGFGWRIDPQTKKEEYHPGLDLKAKLGDLILSAAAGKVLHVGNDPTGYGRWLEIDHGNGVTTIYGHTSEILVKEKDTVKQGQVIAKVGQTGNAQAPHLHFEVRRNGEVIDPAPALGLAQGS